MQQVNLYQKDIWPKKVPFPARTMLFVVGVWVVGLLAAFGVGRWRQDRLENALTAAKAQVAAATRHLAQLEVQYPAKAKDPALAKEADRLAAARDGRAVVLTRLEKKTLGNTSGFSPQFLAFARETVPNLWLRHIMIGHGGRELTLAGGALAATAIPRYLRKLAGEEVFSGMEFDRFRISRPDKTPRQVDFLLETRKAGSGKHH
ncbi:MAG TPA: hypothetical protein VJ955_02545 [Desulfuromonadales bacterium]|nr:hypothetical protein [Desulfuromonadales bacterium]